MSLSFYAFSFLLFYFYFSPLPLSGHEHERPSRGFPARVLDGEGNWVGAADRLCRFWISSYPEAEG